MKETTSLPACEACGGALKRLGEHASRCTRCGDWGPQLSLRADPARGTEEQTKPPTQRLAGRGCGGT